MTTTSTQHEGHRNQAPAVPLIVVRQVSKSFATPQGPFIALDGVDLDIGQGEFVAIVGKSGSGKSTLLNLIAGLDRPSSGDIRIAGVRIQELSENQAAGWRGASMGIVFQFFQLLPTLTVLENVMLPMDFRGGLRPRERRERARVLLERVGVAEQAGKLPAELSGGQQQRVAIARALANDPQVLAADEPTGNLDSATSESILRLFSSLAAEGKTIVMVTHERDVSEFVSRSVRLADGKVVTKAFSEVAHVS